MMEWPSTVHTLLMGFQYSSLSTGGGSSTVLSTDGGSSNLHCLMMEDPVLFTV